MHFKTNVKGKNAYFEFIVIQYSISQIKSKIRKIGNIKKSGMSSSCKRFKRLFYKIVAITFPLTERTV